MRQVHGEELRERGNMKQASKLEEIKQRLNEQYGTPCEECQVRVAREVKDGVGNVEYPAGSHAIGCEKASEGSYHPDDERAE